MRLAPGCNRPAPTLPVPGSEEPYVRDRVTTLAYGALAAYTYCFYRLAPILAFLHAELDLS